MATKQEEQEVEHGDVLLYHDSTRRLGVVWNDKLPRGSKGATIPMQHRHVIQPRLGFCPGRLWAKVSASPAYQEGVEYGTIVALAGHTGDLAEQLASVHQGQLIVMIEKSAGLTTLDRLQAMETESSDPRLDVSEAIELRKKDLAVEVARAKRTRGHDRRANHRRSKRRRAVA